MMFKRISELKYTLPAGGMTCAANLEIIFSHITKYFPEEKEIEITREELFPFYRVFSDEILVALLLDDRQIPVNKALKEGFDFRGIKIRVAD